MSANLFKSDEEEGALIFFPWLYSEMSKLHIGGELRFQRILSKFVESMSSELCTARPREVGHFVPTRILLSVLGTSMLSTLPSLITLLIGISTPPA